MLKYLLIAVLLTGQAFARDLTVEQKLADLTQMVDIIKTGYGPLEYKKVNYGIDVDKLQDKYATLIKATKNNSEFYYLMVKFVAEFNDSHFGASVPTDHYGRVHFDTDLVEGKVLIDTVNREKLSEEKFPFEKGDQIISVNGMPIAKYLDTIIPYMGQGTKLTAKRKAAQLVTIRPGSKMPVWDGKVTFEIRKGTSEFIEKVELEWELKGTPLDEYIPSKTEDKNLMGYMPIDYDMLALDNNPLLERKFRCSGDTRVAIPEDATVIMKKPFVAYYHPTDKGNIGYLRLPHYSPREKDPTVNAVELRFAQYRFAVSELEKNTVGLIIDQDHNCGGSVSYLHNILGLFANKKFKATDFELLATKASYLNFMGWLKKMNKHTREYVSLKKVADLVKDTWLNTNNFLTAKTSILGTEEFYPNPEVNYTHPIIVLIDELSGSGGDAFPAMMQGMGRAKLLGTRTMGAGGHVVSTPPLGFSGINVRMTKSLFYHPNDIAIENNGATPDIKYTHTRDDFMYEYRGYQKFYLNELFKLIK
jgi:hypothetical protein